MWRWDVSAVAHVFRRCAREAALAGQPPGCTRGTLSSGAALFGSPLSGGYAGAKAAIRWLTDYAADESQRAGLGIRFVADWHPVRLGAAAALPGDRAWRGVRRCLRRQGRGGGAARGGRPGGVLTPEQVGQAVTGLVLPPTTTASRPAYLVTAAGLRPLP